ncbi:uncharacterized protein C1orf167 homolog [Mus pahari]|uniref:uncharacterized protein C1orf167 homolog n=1 Tax=Mus pahari TaxID=10093 RepID=UPI000A313CD2|nr:uncharacterized protein C1orf167 homolog [Mus pahari]
MCQVTTHSQGPVLSQKPCQVQSNLACPHPRLALALKDTTGQLGDAALQQQSNLQLPAGRSQGRIREPFVQQSNLCFRGTTSPHLQYSCLPPTGPSSHQKHRLQVAGCLDSRLSGDLEPLDGFTRPGPRPWCRSGSWAPRLVGEPLTLEDLSVSVHSQSQASSPSSCRTAHWLLDSTQHLEPENKAQNIVTLDSQAACRKLLSESFRVWRRLSQRHQAEAKATAMRQRQLIRKSLRELRWVLWLQETRLETAWKQQAKALLVRSFQKWRHVALQQKPEQPQTQAAPTVLASRGSLSLERKAAADLAWRRRCFRAWQQLAQRGAQYRRHLAHRRVRTLRVCLRQWMEMKRLQASDVTKVTQLALHRQKAGNGVLSGLAPGAAMAHCLETVTHAQQVSKGPDQCSLWEIRQKLALCRTLLLWRTRFYRHQQAVVLLSWSHWTAAQGALGELAAHWAWNWSCGAVMGLGRQRLAGWWTVQENPGVRPGTGQQFLREQYQRWGQVHLPVLQKVVSRDWTGSRL